MPPIENEENALKIP